MPLSRTTTHWLRWAVTAILLFLVLRTVDAGATVALLARGSAPLAVAALAIALVDRLVMAMKWYPLLRIQAAEIGLPAATRTYFAASLAGRFLPTSVGSDVLRAVGLGSAQGKVAEIGVSIVVERLLGLAAAALLALAAIAVAIGGHPEVGGLLPWALAALAAVLVLGFAPFVSGLRALPRSLYARFPGLPGKRLLQRADQAYAAYRQNGLTVLVVGIATLAEQLVPILLFGVLAVALGRFPGTETLFVAIPLTMLVARLPVAVDGLGVLEGALVVFTGFYGVDGETALALAVAYRIVGVAAALPGAFFWKELGAGRRPARAASAPETSPGSPGGGSTGAT